MTNGIGSNNLPPQFAALFAKKDEIRKEIFAAIREAVGNASAAPSQATNAAPFQSTSAPASQATSAPFAATTASPSPAAGGYPNVGSQLTGGKDRISLESLDNLLFGKSGADYSFDRGELKTFMPASSVRGLLRGADEIDVGALLERIAAEADENGSVTPSGIDKALKGAIDANGGPRGITDLSWSKQMSRADFDGLIDESFGLMGEALPTEDERNMLFREFAGQNGRISPAEFKRIANIDTDKSFSLTEAGGNILDSLNKMRAEQPALPYPNVGSMLTGPSGKIGIADLGQTMRNASGADGILNFGELTGSGFPAEAARALDGITLDELNDAFRAAAPGSGFNKPISARQIDEVLKGLIDARGGPRDVTNVGTTPMDFQSFKDLTKKAMEFSGLETPDDEMLEQMFKNIGGADDKVNKYEFKAGIADINPDDQSFSLTDAGAKLAALYEELKAQTPEPSIGMRLTGGKESIGLNALMRELGGQNGSGADNVFTRKELQAAGLPEELAGINLDEIYEELSGLATGDTRWTQTISADNITKAFENLVQKRSDPKEVVDFSMPWDQQKFVPFAKRGFEAAGLTPPENSLLDKLFGFLAGADRLMSEEEGPISLGQPDENNMLSMKEVGNRLKELMKQVA